MKRAIVRITTDWVHDLLKLPADVEIAGIHVEPDRDGMTLGLRGEGLPECCNVHDPGWVSPEVTCTYTTRSVLVIEFQGFK